MEMRVVAILLQLVDGLRRGESIQKVRRGLVEKGHSEEEVDFALSYLLYATEAHPDLPWGARFSRPDGLGVVSGVERFALSGEAYGYLLALRALNLITALEMEEIVDQILVSAHGIAGVDEVRALVARLLVEESPLDRPPYPEEEPETEQ